MMQAVNAMTTLMLAAQCRSISDYRLFHGVRQRRLEPLPTPRRRRRRRRRRSTFYRYARDKR